MVETNYTRGIFPRWADICSQALVIYSLITFTVETDPNVSGHDFFWYSEIIVLTIFLFEYLARIYFARNRFGYITSFYGVIDILAILPAIVSLGFVDLRFARIFRLMRVLRLLKFARYIQSTDVLRRAFSDIKGELFVFCFVAIIVIYVSAVGIYTFEHEAQPENFRSITHAMWWSVVTLTTVGYGDVYPITAGGKLFTGVILFIGLGTVAIPSGLFAASLTNVKMEQNAAKKKAAEEAHKEKSNE